MLTLLWATRGAAGSRRWRSAGVMAAVGVVVLVVGFAVGVGVHDRADTLEAPEVGARGSFDDQAPRTVAGQATVGAQPAAGSLMPLVVPPAWPGPSPCEVYGWREGRYRAEHRWLDRFPTWRGDGTEIVFADLDALYAVSADGTQLWRPVREEIAFHVRGRSRYVLEGFVSLDVSDVDGALVYATCWSYAPDGGDPDVARCRTRTDVFHRPDFSDCLKKLQRFGKVRLAFPSGDVHFRIGDDLYAITVVQPNEGTASRLYLGNFPAWSPDGRRIAFVSEYWRTGSPPAGGLLSRVIGSRVTRVNRIPMAADGGGQRSRVHTMAADGTDLHTIELPPGRYADYPPRWSPDGTRLAFLAIEDDARLGVRGDATFAIYLVGADGTGLKRLAAASSNPAWSPDGTRLAFVKATGGRLHLYTMAADGADIRQVTSAPVAWAESKVAWVPGLTWSPDGSGLLYRCGAQVCVVGLDGQQTGAFRYPRHGALLPAWSADGRRVALYNAVPAAGAAGSHEEVVLASIAPDGSDPRVLVRQRAGTFYSPLPAELEAHRLAFYNAVPAAEQRHDEVGVASLGFDGSDWRVLVRQRAGLVAAAAANSDPGAVATRAACRAGMVVPAPAPAQHPGLVADCEALVALRAELFGWAGMDWTANNPLSYWEGVLVGGAPPRVRELVLEAGAIGTFDHGGRLPPGMAELAFLERLDLSDNRLTGSIPAAWGALARLRWLDLSGNELTGAIPAALGQLANLERLRLADNQLTGCIPVGLRDVRDNDLAQLKLPDC